MNNIAHPVERPLVTVALSVLNGGSLLELSVRSVLNQSWSNWELLILDDGSTDGAIDRLPFLSDPRITVVRDGSNRGLSARLNQAVSIAKGKYFARMDHDDICHPERFACQVEFLETHTEVDLLATQCVTMDEQERLNGSLPYFIEHKAICSRPWRGFYMPHPTWMGRIEWFRRNSYQDPGPYCCEDQELLLRAHLSSCYHTLPKSLLAYRIRSHPRWQKLLRTHVAMLKMKIRYFHGRGEWVGVILTISAEFARIARDSWRALYCRLSLLEDAQRGFVISLEERHGWEENIKTLKAETGASGNSELQDANS